MISRIEAIEHLKNAQRYEELHNTAKMKEKNLQVTQVFIDRLLDKEEEERRRVAMAKKIQRVFRCAVANPEYKMCKRRLQRECDDLNSHNTTT